MKISILLVDGTVEGPTEAREVRDSFLSGKISLDAMIMPEGEPAVWIPITSIFDAGTSLNQSLRRLARERMFNGLNAWLKFAAWILVTACVACLAVFLGVGLIVGELSKGPSWNRQRVAPVQEAEGQAREFRFKKLIEQSNAVNNRLEFSKQREEDCKALLIQTKSDQKFLKVFEELGMKLVHYHLELGSKEPEKLPLLEAEVFALPSPWWIYFEPEGLALYFADDSALQFAVRERNTAYRNAVIAYEKAGSVEDWIKKKEYLDLQIEAVQSVLD